MARGGARKGAGRPFLSRKRFDDLRPHNLLEDRLALAVVESVRNFIGKEQAEAIKRRVDRSTRGKHRDAHEGRADFWDCLEEARQTRRGAESERDRILDELIATLNMTRSDWSALPLARRKNLAAQNGYTARIGDIHRRLCDSADEIEFLLPDGRTPESPKPGARYVSGVPSVTKAQLTAAFSASAAKLGLNRKQVASFWKRWHAASKLASAPEYVPDKNAQHDDEADS